jgi:quercetin dioxygenase-like cupin family protein
MSEAAFRAAAADKGYGAPVEKTWAAGHFNDWHVHPFCLFVYILGGEMTLELETAAGVEAVHLGPGGSIEVPVNVRHTERIGDTAARFLSAPRHPA